MRFSFALLLFAVFVGQSNAIARPTQPQTNSHPAAITFKMTADKASELVQGRTREIDELTAMRDEYCARADQACADTFENVIDGRALERGTLERIRQLLSAENATEAEKVESQKKADQLTRRYNVLNMGYTAMLNRLKETYVLKQVTAADPQVMHR